MGSFVPFAKMLVSSKTHVWVENLQRMLMQDCSKLNLNMSQPRILVEDGFLCLSFFPARSGNLQSASSNQFFHKPGSQGAIQPCLTEMAMMENMETILLKTPLRLRLSFTLNHIY